MERFAKIINKNLHKTFHLRWDEVLKNRPSKICGRQHLKSYLVHSWILGLRCLIEFWICFCTILHERLSNISKYYLVWKTSVIRQKGKRANLKTEVTRKESTPNFPKNTFLPRNTHTYVCVSGGMKCLFFRKFDVLWKTYSENFASCNTRSEICPFTLLPTNWKFNSTKK